MARGFGLAPFRWRYAEFTLEGPREGSFGLTPWTARRMRVKSSRAKYRL